MSNESILIRGVNWLGDAVMSTPALQRLREAKPEARLVLLTHEKLRDLWTGHPALDRIVTFPNKASVFAVGRLAREQGCDTALIFPNSPRSAIECWRAGIPRRIGLARPWGNWFLTERLPSRRGAAPMIKRSAEEVRLLVETGIAIKQRALPADAHHLFNYLHLAGALGARQEPCAPFIAVSGEATSAVCKKFNAAGPGGRLRPLIAVNPGAEYGPAKRWPKERFIETAVKLNERRACDWWILGGPDDGPLAAGMAEAIRTRVGRESSVESLGGRTSLAELCAVAKAVDVFLTNDTGPMHVAAAVGTPVVALFGSSSPELTAPGLPGDDRHQLVREAPACSPCYLRECPIDFRCMTGITVEKVLAALDRTLESVSGRR
jgi:heptosyltransferase-2